MANPGDETEMGSKKNHHPSDGVNPHVKSTWSKGRFLRALELQVVTWGDTSSGADSRRVKEQLENCRDLSCPGLFTREKLYILTVPRVFFFFFLPFRNV